MQQTPKHTNQLIHESSPYLLQHAHNPVNWYPWGAEALQLAKELDKPILVSIGYAACHWCHVMERESFEAEATAAIMNDYFVNIKIDREERPDLDHIYMDAVQAMTGSGGWPLNVFLTPEGKPFYGGTYFPPKPLPNRPSWHEILHGVFKAYTEKRTEIDTQAATLTAHIQQSNFFGNKAAALDSVFAASNLTTTAHNMLAQADKVWGGFGQAPKFPQCQSIRFLMAQYHQTGQKEALDQALLSLDKMMEGGIYDQLGGGFARYSTDNSWLAPHFEKMLYDNALLVTTLSEAFQLTRQESYERAIRETLAFVERELMEDGGGFYSALDADSEGVEGKYYVWQKAEVMALLGEEGATFCAYYDITEEGNWEHTNILRLLQTPKAFALGLGLKEAAWLEQVAIHKAALLQQRNQRIRPQLDDKQLLGWNALMITAYCDAYAALGDAHYQEVALKTMAFLEKAMKGPDGQWMHTYKKGQAKIPAFLDDYAWLMEALIHLQEITGNGDYLLKASTLLEWVNLNFSDISTGFYNYTHINQTDVIVRKKEVYDGATPSGNAVMCWNLLYLSRVFERADWKEQAVSMLGALVQAIVKYPNSFGYWARCMQNEVGGWKEIALVGKGAGQYLPRVLNCYTPWKIIQVEETKTGKFPLLAGKTAKNGEPVFYLCRDYACSEYTTDKIADFLAKV